MVAQNGKDLLIKIDMTGDGLFETAAGLRAMRAIPLPFVGQTLQKIGGVLKAQVGGQQRSCKRNGKLGSKH